MCRLVDCDIGGWKQVEEAIQKAAYKSLPSQSNLVSSPSGVMSIFARPLSPYTIKLMDTRSLPDERLMHENSDLALVRESLVLSLAKRPNISIQRPERNSL